MPLTLPRLFSRAASRPPPQRAGSNTGLTFASSVIGTGNAVLVNSMPASGWLFGCVDRIASSIAATKWQLFSGETQLKSHPLLTLWSKPNPYLTGFAFREIGAQHFELTGETWWALVKGLGGLELWPMRPDRVRILPDVATFIKGYVYTIGGQDMPLEPRDVISIMRPNPADIYRGIGVVEAALVEIETDKAASMWTRAFYRNSAEPGGVIETPTRLSETEFDEFKMRWRELHQGVANAHRVALLEGGMEWKDVKFSQRDMQFVDWRKFNRDFILGAFGMPQSALGISETVNRATAEADAAVFGRWVLTPRLNRIQAVLNEMLCPLFGDNLRFEFESPVPDDRVQDLAEAVQGYEAGALTLDESRILLDQAPIGGTEGDERKQPIAPPAGQPFNLSISTEPRRTRTPPALPERKPRRARGDPALPAPKTPLVKADDDDLTDEEREERDRLEGGPVAAAERDIARGWRDRLSTEGEAIAAYVLGDAPKSLNGRRKIDVSAYNWDWSAKYGADVIDELLKVFFESMMRAEPSTEPAKATLAARAYAEARGGALISNVTDTTRARVNQIIHDGLEAGDSLGQMAKGIRDDYIFSRDRARMVARTETATALGQGGKQAAQDQGRDQKRWVTQGSGVEEVCLGNENAGWLRMNVAFPSGHDVVPAHPNCRCACIFRTGALHEETVARAECPLCGKLLGKDVSKGTLRCRECKIQVVFGKGEPVIVGTKTPP